MTSVDNPTFVVLNDEVFAQLVELPADSTAPIVGVCAHDLGHAHWGVDTTDIPYL